MKSSNLLKQLERDAEVGRAVVELIARLKEKYRVKRSPSTKPEVAKTKKASSKKVVKKAASKIPVPPAA